MEAVARRVSRQTNGRRDAKKTLPRGKAMLSARQRYHISAEAALCFWLWKGGRIQRNRGLSRALYLYERKGRAIMHIDNAGQENSNQHVFVDENGQETHAHYHTAVWDKDGDFKDFGKPEDTKAVTDAMREDFPDLLNGR